MANALRDLYEKRNRLYTEAQAINQKATAEKRDLSADESRQWDALIADSDACKKQIDREERLMSMGGEIEAAGRQGGHIGNGAVDGTETEQRQLVAYRNFLLGKNYEARDLQVDTDTKGGYWVPAKMQTAIRQELDNNIFVRGLATVNPEAIGVNQSLGIPTLGADIADLAWSSEVGSVGLDTSMTAGKRALVGHLLAKGIKVSMALLESRPDAESIVAQRMGFKHSAVLENAYFNGSGANEPLGLFTASANGISTGRDMSTDNTTTAVTYDGLVNAKYNLKAQFRQRAVWVGHRALRKAVSKIKDGEDRPIFTMGQGTGQTDTLLGHPFYETEYAPSTFTTGLYVGLFGDLKFYEIVDCKFSIQRLNELYAANNQVGFFGRGGGDAMPIFESAFTRVTLA